MNSSLFWEAFHQPEPERWKTLPINAWDTPLPKARDYAGNFHAFCSDVLGTSVWGQTAKLAELISRPGPVRFLTPMEQYNAEKVWFRRWWEKVGLPLWRGKAPGWVLTSLACGKLVRLPIPREPGRSLLDWTICSGWPENSPPKKKPAPANRAGL